MKKINILIIGEHCIDKFEYCTSSRLSPEAPVPVLNPYSIRINEGMAGNTKQNVKALVDVKDWDINSIFPKDKNTGYDLEITKTRYIEEKSNHMFFRVDEGEDNIEPFKWGMDTDVLIGQADIVIVSDYNKGFLRDMDLIEIADKSTLSILDSKRKLTNVITQHFNFVKLNKSERNNNPNLITDNIITTLGPLGAEYQSIIYPSPNPQQTIDVSGAGDTFTAAFIIKYYETKDVGLSIEFANTKSSEVVSKRGVVVPS